MITEALAKVIVGLGNPGTQYEWNRHNLGFMVLDALAREKSGRWLSSVPSQKLVAYIGEQSAALARRADDGISGIFRGGPTPPASARAGEICNEFLGRDTSMLSRTCRIEIGSYPVLLVEPLTYMNNSGKAVQVLLTALQRSPQDLLLIFDDLNLPFGRIRIRERGSAGGHHGLESILSALNTEEIVRLRIGIGEDQMPGGKSDFVLADFPPGRQAELSETIMKAGNAVKSILMDGISKTMAIFNA